MLSFIFSLIVAIWWCSLQIYLTSSTRIKVSFQKYQVTSEMQSALFATQQQLRVDLEESKILVVAKAKANKKIKCKQEIKIVFLVMLVG